MSKNDYFEYMYQIDEEYERRLNDDHARWPKTNPTISNLKISKEEKKMHKKRRVHGHVVHKLPKCVGLYYTVEPEHSCIAVYVLMYDPATGEPYYSEFEDITIRTKQLGRHGYLEEQIEWIARRHSALTPIRNYLERDKMLYDNTFAGSLSYIKEGLTVLKEDLKSLNDAVFKEEKKMTEYYVIDVEMTDADLKTKRTECLQIRQYGNYFEIPFDGPADISEYRLDRLVKCLCNYINDTNKMFSVSLEKSEIGSNSVLKITTPYADISDDRNREELCKMLTYAAEHNEYPGPARNMHLAKINFYLRECNNREIYKKAYFVGIDCTIRISGMIVRGDGHFDYIPVPTDVVGLKFQNGRLTHFMLAGDSSRGWEAVSEKTPGPLYHIYHHDEPFQHVEEVKSLLRDICNKRRVWKNAAYITFVVFGNQD